MKILHVIATPRGDHSQTLPFSRAFPGHLAKARPDLTVQELDLSTTTLPTIDDTIASTKYRLMQGLPVDLDAAKTWPRVEALIDDFVSADLCLITTPMWNFRLPHKLKHWIDCIVQPAGVWGDGDPEGVRQRAAQRMADTARAAALLGVDVVIGFTGSAIWKYVAMFPPVSAETIEAGYQDFADRWDPILDVYDEVGVRFAHEVHPSEIAYDYWTTVRTLEAIGHRPAFGLNWDPSHMVWQQLDPVGFIWDFQDRIYHVDCKDVRMRVGNGRNGRLSSHLPWADARRGWDFVSTGHGDVPWEDCFRALNSIGYDGPISVEWEDAGMDRLIGAAEAVGFVRRLAFDQPEAAFDAAFSSGD